MQELSEDERKVLLNVLAQLSYKVGDARVIIPIVDKLSKGLDLTTAEDAKAKETSETLTKPNNVQ